MFPISNTGISAAYILATVHFLYPKLGSSSNMEYYFYQLAYRDSKVPKHFVGLIQMQCSPSFDCNWSKQNNPTASWHQLHPRYRVSQQEKCLSYPPNCVGGEGLCPLRTPINRWTPPPHTLYLGQRAAEKPSTFLAIFMGLSLTPITNTWSAS